MKLILEKDLAKGFPVDFYFGHQHDCASVIIHPLSLHTIFVNP